MPTGNDASTKAVAKSNCSFCAVAGIAGKTSSEVMRMVYNKMGKALPNGVDDDSSQGFAEYYHFHNKEKTGGIPDAKLLKYQVEGIRLFLMHRGYRTAKVGDIDKLMTTSDTERQVDSCVEGTLFLVLAGDEDIPGKGLSTLVHWTAGQVQGGHGVYYDYQTKMTDPAVRRMVKVEAARHRIDMNYDDTSQSDHLIGPLGQSYDSSDGRAMLIKVLS